MKKKKSVKCLAAVLPLFVLLSGGAGRAVIQTNAAEEGELPDEGIVVEEIMEENLPEEGIVFEEVLPAEEAADAGSDFRETEVNNSFGTANAIRTGVICKGNIHEDGDMDYYKFTIAKDGVIRIYFSHAYLDTGSNFWSVALFHDRARDQAIVDWSYSGKEDDWKDNGGIGLPAGTYFLVVRKALFSSLEYRFRVDYTASDAWEKEFNDSFSVATPVSAGKRTHGSLSWYNDADYFRFTLSKPTNVTILFQHEYINSSSTCWNMSLFNESNQSVAVSRWDMKGNNVSQNASAGRLAAGTYYILVRDSGFKGSNRDYSITVSTAAGWMRDGKGWWYEYADGSYPRNRWAEIDGKWYRFNSAGYMQTGWIRDGGKWYCLDARNGYMRIGWVQSGGRWYYMNRSGVMQKGWVQSGGKWYYLNGNGEMVANTSVTWNGKTYNFNAKGECTNP